MRRNFKRGRKRGQNRAEAEASGSSLRRRRSSLRLGVQPVPSSRLCHHLRPILVPLGQTPTSDVRDIASEDSEDSEDSEKASSQDDDTQLQEAESWHQEEGDAETQLQEEETWQERPPWQRDSSQHQQAPDFGDEAIFNHKDDYVTMKPSADEFARLFN